MFPDSLSPYSSAQGRGWCWCYGFRITVSERLIQTPSFYPDPLLPAIPPSFYPNPLLPAITPSFHPNPLLLSKTPPSGNTGDRSSHGRRCTFWDTKGTWSVELLESGTTRSPGTFTSVSVTVIGLARRRVGRVARTTARQEIMFRARHRPSSLR